MRRPTLCLLGVVTAACPGNDICMPTTFAPETTAFALTGAPVTVPMTLPVTCGARKPTGVTVSVLGPSDQRVDAGSDAPTVDMTGFSTNVTFTPMIAGSYHVSARFEPNLGLAQFDLVAAADRRDAGAAFVIPSADIAACTHVEVTKGGRLVCISGMGVQVFDGSPPHMGAIAEYADNALWIAENGSLTRWLETDAGFAPAETLTVTPLPAQLLPTANDVVAIGSTTASFVTANDGGLETRPIAMLPNPPAQWRDANVYGRLNARSFCTQPLDGGTTPPPCPTLSAFTPGLTSIGVDTAGIWATEMTLGGTSFVYHLDTDGSSSLKLPTGWTPRPRDADWETAALIDGDAGTLVLGGDITLEAYARPGEQLTHACTRFVVVSSGGTSRVIAR